MGKLKSIKGPGNRFVIITGNQFDIKKVIFVVDEKRLNNNPGYTWVAPEKL